MRKHVKHGCGKQSAMLHLGFKTGTGGRNGSPLRKRHDMTFNSIHKREILKGSNIFRKFHSPPPYQCNFSPAWFLTVVNRLTHPQHTPTRTKGTAAWEWKWGQIKMSDGPPKSMPVAMPLAYARVYPEPRTKVMAKIRNSVGVDTILKILLPSNIMSSPTQYQCWSWGTLTDKHFKKNIEIGAGGIILKTHPFYSRIYSLMFLPKYSVQHCRNKLYLKK